jgi:NAD+ synthase (glutamine-hydrolysing)
MSKAPPSVLLTRWYRAIIIESVKQKSEFNSPSSHGFVRVAVCVPHLKVAEPEFNVERTIELAKIAAGRGSAIALFPELGLSAYSNEDLFHQEALLAASLSALGGLVEATRGLSSVVVVGVPLRFEQRLYNCAVAVCGGEVLAAAPKSYLPNYREFYEKRQFASAFDAVGNRMSLLGWDIPFGNDIVLQAAGMPDFAFHMEICEDLWAPIPPSTYAALGGATLLLNLSASNITIGKAEYRKALASAQSGRCIAAYLYSAAGHGESTTDLAWDGDALIYENAELLRESDRFSQSEQCITADIDLEALSQDRMRLTSWGDTAAAHRDRVGSIRVVPFEFSPPVIQGDLDRRVPRFPYVPSDLTKRDERCFEAYNIQVAGLTKRLEHTGIKKIVIGISGGLDSTHALIVAARALERAGLPRTNILAYTMPGFATSTTTLANAHALMAALKVRSSEIDIRPSCMQMFKDLGHPFADGKKVYDITFENVQAGERTSHLFRLANAEDALVLGTGDLSELALGWATYGVGDHMSHYNVNASVPKTLIQYLIRWVADTELFDTATSEVLRRILATEISPELIPADSGSSDKPSQSTESKIGPYELQDFNLYYTTRYGFKPSKVAFLSYQAWKDKTKGSWPDPIPEEGRHEYDLAAIKHWLDVFLYRFFQISQFKRSAVPNGPKVGSGGSLSPRGDWRAPSDAEADLWLRELRENVPET